VILTNLDSRRFHRLAPLGGGARAPKERFYARGNQARINILTQSVFRGGH